MQRRDFLTSLAAPVSLSAVTTAPTDIGIVPISKAVALAGLHSAQAFSSIRTPSPSTLAEHALAAHTLAHHLNESPRLHDLVNRHLAGTTIAWDASAAVRIREETLSRGITGLTPDVLDPLTQLGASAQPAPTLQTLLAQLHALARHMDQSAHAMESAYLAVSYRADRRPAALLRRVADNNGDTSVKAAGLLGASGTGLVYASGSASNVMTAMGASAELGAAVASSLLWTGVGLIVVAAGVAAYILLTTATSHDDGGGGTFRVDSGGGAMELDDL